MGNGDFGGFWGIGVGGEGRGERGIGVVGKDEDWRGRVEGRKGRRRRGEEREEGKGRVDGGWKGGKDIWNLGIYSSNSFGHAWVRDNGHSILTRSRCTSTMLDQTPLWYPHPIPSRTKNIQHLPPPQKTPYIPLSPSQYPFPCVTSPHLISSHLISSHQPPSTSA